MDRHNDRERDSALGYATPSCQGGLKNPEAGPGSEPIERATIYLHPGQIFASPEPCAITTILGSCVAVCLWDPLAGVGGACHYMLPHMVGGEQSSPRFGDVAVRHLIQKCLALGGRKHNLQAKIFGGACVLEAFREKESHLGTQNVRLAYRLLKGEGIPIQGEDVEGRQSRKLIFHTDCGAAWVRRL